MSLPRTYNADGSAVCRHRDLSVCAECATDDRYVEVYGVHYFIDDPRERLALLEELADVFDPDPVVASVYEFLADPEWSAKTRQALAEMELEAAR